MPTKHLRYGGSTMARTINCTGWAALAAQLPKGSGTTSEAAELGTALHDCMEHIFNTVDMQPYQAVGLVFNRITITGDMVEEKVEPAYIAMEHLLNHYHIDEYMLEPFVEFQPDLAGGSIDFIGVSRDGKTVVIADYKFGYNLVSPCENAQLLFYALCADIDERTADMFKHAEKLVLAIIQPSTEQDTLQIWETPINVLDDFETRVANAIILAESGKEQYAAGPHCKFCPAEAICPMKTGLAQTASRFPQPTVDKLGEILPMAEELEEWIKAVKKMAHEALEQGQKVDGYKLVNKRASRVWTDAEAVTKKLKGMRGLSVTDAHDMKLKSPAQMEKLFKEKGLDLSKIGDYITSMSSGTTMAKASDKRPEVPSIEAYKAAMARLPE